MKKVSILLLLLLAICGRSFILGDYERVELFEAQSSSQIQNLIEYARSQIVSEAITKGSFASADFQLSTIISISRQVLDNEHYRISCQFKNKVQDIIEASLDLTYNSDDDSQQLNNYNYTVKNVDASTQVDNSFVIVSSNEVKQSQEISEVLDFGIQQVNSKINQENRTLAGSYSLSSTNVVWKQVVGQAIFYKFDALLTTGSLSVQALFTIYYQPLLNTLVLVDYSYIKITSLTDYQSPSTSGNGKSPSGQDLGQSPNSGYVRLDEGHALENSEVFEVVRWGIDKVVGITINIYDDAPSTQFDLSRLVYISKKNVSSNSAFYYYVIAELRNTGNWLINTTFTVYYTPSTDTKSLWGYRYNSISGGVNTPDYPTEYGYNNVDIGSVQNNATFNSILQFGVQAVLNSAVIAGDLSTASGWELSNLLNVSKKSTLRGTVEYYYFECQIVGQNGQSMNSTFTIYVNPGSGSNVLWNSFYALSAAPIVPPTPYNPSDISPAPAQNSTAPVSNSSSTTDAQIGQYTSNGQLRLDQTRALENPEINSVIQWGIADVVRICINVFNDAPNTTFSLAKLLWVSERQVRNNTAVYYKFITELRNPQYWLINTTFTVFLNRKTGNMSLWGYYYNSLSPNVNRPVPNQILTPIEAAYQSISIQELATDSILQGTLRYGGAQVISNLISSGKIPSLTYTLTSVQNIWSQIVGNALFYKYQCQFSDNTSTWVIDSIFSVQYAAFTQEKTLISYSYDTNQGNGTDTSDAPSDNSDDQNSGQNTTVNNTQSAAGTWIALSLSDVQSSSLIQKVIIYGVQQVYYKGVTDLKIPNNTQFSVSRIISIARQEVTQGDLYMCQLQLSSNGSITVNTTFIVYVSSTTDEMKITDSSYSVSIPSPPQASDNSDEYVSVDASSIKTDTVLLGALTYGVKQVVQIGLQDQTILTSNYKLTNLTSIKKKSTDSGDYYSFDIILSNTRGSIIDMQFIVLISNSQNSLVSYSYTVQTTDQSVQLLDTDFTEIDQAEYSQSSEIKNCLNFGINAVIPNISDFNSPKIVQVVRQIYNSAIYYRFTIQLSNDESSVQAIFTVYLNPTNNNLAMIDYTIDVQSSNSSGTPATNVNTNTTASYSNSSNSQNYTQVNTTDAQNSENYQQIIRFGVKECLTKLLQKKIISGLNFTVNAISGAFEQTATSTYKFEITLANSVGISLDVWIEVLYNSTTQSLLHYSIAGSSNTTIKQDNVVVADEVTNSSQSTQQSTVKSCKKVADQEVSNSTEIQGAVNYGVGTVVSLIVQKEGFSITDFALKTIKRVLRESSNDQNYRVAAVLQNSIGQTIDCQFVVNYRSVTQTQNLISYFYTAYSSTSN